MRQETREIIKTLLQIEVAKLYKEASRLYSSNQTEQLIQVESLLREINGAYEDFKDGTNQRTDHQSL